MRSGSSDNASAPSLLYAVLWDLFVFKNHISMRLQIAAHAMTKTFKINSHSFASSKFECWYQVAIPGYHNDHAYHLSK